MFPPTVAMLPICVVAPERIAFRQHRVAITHDRVPCQLTVGHGRAHRDRVIRHVDARQAEMPDIHNGVWCKHVDLHQIDQRGPAGKEHGAGMNGHSSRSIPRGGHPLKGEGPHDCAS
jgi:hypothetical protein